MLYYVRGIPSNKKNETKFSEYCWYDKGSVGICVMYLSQHATNIIHAEFMAFFVLWWCNLVEKSVCL